MLTLKPMDIFRLIPALLILLVSCQKPEAGQSSITAFVGATLIDGSGAAPMENAFLLIQDGRVVAVGTADKVEVPEGATMVDVSGKTIMPGIINGHGHVGEV